MNETDKFFPIASSVEASFSTLLDEKAYSHILGVWPSEQSFTVTAIYRVKWWKRPWYWLRRKPTKFVNTYTDCKFSPPRLTEDGIVSVDFTGVHDE